MTVEDTVLLLDLGLTEDVLDDSVEHLFIHLSLLKLMLLWHILDAVILAFFALLQVLEEISSQLPVLLFEVIWGDDVKDKSNLLVVVLDHTNLLEHSVGLILELLLLFGVLGLPVGLVVPATLVLVSMLVLRFGSSLGEVAIISLMVVVVLSTTSAISVEATASSSSTSVLLTLASSNDHVVGAFDLSLNEHWEHTMLKVLGILLLDLADLELSDFLKEIHGDDALLGLVLVFLRLLEGSLQLFDELLHLLDLILVGLSESLERLGSHINWGGGWYEGLV